MEVIPERNLMDTTQAGRMQGMAVFQRIVGK